MEIDMVILFKAELKNLTLLESLLERKKLELDKVLYRMYGITGIDPTKEPIGKNTDFDRIVDLIPEKDRLLNEINVLTTRIQNVYKVLANMNKEDRRLISEIYIKGVTFDEMSKKTGYSVRQLKRRTHRILKMALSPL